MAETIKVYGPPGTGKTTWLLNRVQDELASGITPEQIVYTAFTKSAANEARDRALIKFSDYSPNEFCWFSTIHSICFRRLDLRRENVFAGRVLKEFCNTFGYDAGGYAEDNGDTDTELHDRVLRTDADYFEYFINWYRNLMIDFDEAYRRFMLNTDLPSGFTYDRIKMYIQRRNEFKREKSLWDFSDMVESVFANNIVPSDNIKVMFSDEYQDLSPLLASITSMWAKHVERYYIGGDVYQSIYQWMGADPSIMLNLKADKNVTLKQSYRCPIQVHDLSRRIVNRFAMRYNDDDFTPTNNPGDIIKIFPMQLDWQDIIDKRVFYLHRTNWLLGQAFDQLVQNGIPFTTVRGRLSPLQTVKAKVANSLMKLIDGKYVPATDMCKIMEYLPTRTAKEEFLTQGAKTDMKKIAAEHSNRNFSVRDLHNLGFTGGFMRHFDHEDIFTPCKFELIEKDYFRRLVKQYGSNILDKEPSLLLSTLHGVKGMECDTVIINLNLTRKTYESMESDPDPEHRLFYVGVTRSRNKVILLQPEGYKGYYL